ncbi:MAG: DNA primase, partial [Gemmataceae bacterium]
CGKHGDVISFLIEHDRLSFREALELLARRAGISLEKIGGRRQNSERAVMLDLMKWTAEQFQNCLRHSPMAESARLYLEERRLSAESIGQFGIGFAPPGGNWLIKLASQSGRSLELLEKLGLVGKRTEDDGYYDRFRDRIIFPIRDSRGQTVGFGGRILPSSPSLSKPNPPPKYYNSTETPLFTKSEHLFGLDQALNAGRALGYLAVVEGYTDVIMAHQYGITQVVATLGTALNARHVQHLRRFVPRVVLVFDADAAGQSAVDRALEIFVSQNVELAIATLPAGLDPCDLLVQQGAEPMATALQHSVDALEFKLNQTFTSDRMDSVEGKRQAVEEVLKVIALAPEMVGHEGAIRRDLILNRIATRAKIEEKTVRARIKELHAGAMRPRERRAEEEPRQSAPAPQREKELIQVLLAEPELVPTAAASVVPDELEHPGLRRLLEAIYRLHTESGRVDLDELRALLDNPRLGEKVLEFADLGRRNADRAGWLRDLLAEFEKHRLQPAKAELKSKLQAARDHTEAVDLLRQLQKH